MPSHRGCLRGGVSSRAASHSVCTVWECCRWCLLVQSRGPGLGDGKVCLRVLGFGRGGQYGQDVETQPRPRPSCPQSARCPALRAVRTLAFSPQGLLPWPVRAASLSWPFTGEVFPLPSQGCSRRPRPDSQASPAHTPISLGLSCSLVILQV